MNHFVLGIGAIAGLIATLPAAPTAQAPAIGDLVARVSEYATRYQQDLSGIVSEETYQQAWYRRLDRMPEARTLRSDVLLTRPPAGTRYVLFRDVFEVDGRQVRDREERLAQLFLGPTGSTSTQLVRILEESARYNIGEIRRTVNTPTFALVFLDPQFRHRLAFELTGDRIPETVRTPATSTDGAAAMATPDDVTVVSYRETGRETLIVDGNGDGLQSSGRFWVDAASGRIRLSELQLLNARIEAVVDVRYEEQPAIGLMVPVAMRERYRDLRRNTMVEGAAVYARVRRFQVATTEAVGEPAR